MWLLSILPDFVFHLITLVGIVGIIISLVPLIPYRSIVQISAVLMLSFGIYAEGAISQKQLIEIERAHHEAEVARLKAEMAKIERYMAEITTKVITKYVERVTVATEKADEITKYVPYYITQKDDANCTINNGFVVLHNAAAANATIPKTPGATNEEASGIELSTVSETISKNYKTCHTTRIQLEELQNWVREQEQEFNKTADEHERNRP